MTKTTPCTACGGLGERLTPEFMRSIREQEGLTLSAAAKKLGIGRSYLCDIELGKRLAPHAIEKFYRKLAGLPV